MQPLTLMGCLMNTKILALTLAAAVPFVSAVADNDIDLPINGDFRGQPVGYSPAPGWTLTADGGNANILPTNDRDDFILELRAEPGRGQSAVSELHRLPGNMLKLELKVSGIGNASAGYEAYDATGRTLLGSDRQLVALTAFDQKIKRYFTLPAQAGFVRIRLTAEAGSTARFRDVDADVSVAPAQSAPQTGIAAPAPGTVAAPPAAPGAIAAPPVAPGAIAAPPAAPASTVAAPAPAPAATAAPAAPAAPAGNFALLQNDKYYAYMFLGKDEHYEISLPVGSDIDFELGENPGSRIYWRVVSYNAGVVRVKLEHERDGLDKSEIELKAIGRGSTDVVLTTGEKQFTVHFTAL